MIKINKDLLALSEKRFSEITIERDTLTLFYATCFSRFFSLLDSVIILNESGLSNESKIVCRSMLELTYKVKAVDNDNQILDHILGEDLFLKMNRIKKYLHRKLANKEVNIEELELQKTELEREIDDRNIRMLQKKEIAEIAKMEQYHLISYDLLSDPAHIAPKDLYSLIIVEDGEISKIRLGRDTSIKSDALYTSAILSILLLGVFGKHFKINLDQELSDFDDEISNKSP